MITEPTAATTPNATRCAGILLHPSALDGIHGMGDLGPGAQRFVEWLDSAGMTAWQVLPLVPPGAGNSPYSSWSAFAGNPLLISLEALVDDGLLRAEEVEVEPWMNSTRVEYDRVRGYKLPRLHTAARRLLDGGNPELLTRFESFRTANPWLEDTVLFAALRPRYEMRGWWEWPPEVRRREMHALDALRREYGPQLEELAVIQFFFDAQWQSLADDCEARGITLIGDLPIYVDWDSVDVWVHQDLFRLDEMGTPEAVSGVPPDAFSDTGQLWGNPLYHWENMAAQDFGWWCGRMARALALTPRVRIDHFRGFASYWAVPFGADDARGGEWREGPGDAVFEAFRTRFGSSLSFIAEDLGLIDQPVRDLLATTGLPGMKVLQFAFGTSLDHIYLPHNHQANSVAYTGTHDNDTTLGWWEKATEGCRDHVRRYFGIDGHDVVWDLIRAAFASVSHTAIIPMQDVLALGSHARMNTPSQPDGNWGWRLPEQSLCPHAAVRLRDLCTLYGRHPDSVTPESPQSS